MIFQLLILWTIAVVLLVLNPKNKTNRWSSAMAFFAGCGAAAVVLEYTLSPYVRANLANGGQIGNLCVSLANFFDTISYYWSPYAFLMFGISYAGISGFKWRLKHNWYACILLIPIICMYLFFPAKALLKPGSHWSFQVVALWAVLCFTVGDLLLIYSYFRTKNPQLKQEIFLIGLVLIFGSIFVGAVNYVFHLLGLHSAWRYHTISVILFFVLFVIFSIRYGFFGVKVRIERNRLDSTMRAMISGTDVINHAFKNGLAKISLCAENIKEEVISGQPRVNQSIESILQTTEHMLTMVRRINAYMRDIQLLEAPCNLVEIVEQALKSNTLYFQDKKVSVAQKYHYCPRLLCDEIHIREVINNIIKNALEAMNDWGTLQISIDRNNNQSITIAVEDNGPGISREDLARVIEPFFSTKNQNLNFGLGLSYCYNVMQKHGGSLEIHSEVNQGTTVFLNFPAKRVLGEAVELAETAAVGEEIRVLLVDDDPVWVETITQLLAKHRIKVAGTAASQAEAVQLAQKLEYDLILMDLNLNGNPYDGVYATAEINQIRQTKIIVLTSLDEEQTIIDSFTAGAVSFVAKTDYRRIPAVIRAVYHKQTPQEILVKEFTRLKEAEQLKVLTPAEMEIFQLICQGYSQAQIAKMLYKTEGTIKNQVHMILKKLDAANSKEAIWKVRMKGLGREKE